MINRERLRKIFEELVRIDSPSGEEDKVSTRLKEYISDLGGDIKEDNAKEKLNTKADNLFGWFNGSVDLPPIMLCAHMDTVEPCRGIEPVFKNGIFTSKGDTVLGADDKAAVAVIIEVLNVIKDNNLAVCPIDAVFTVFEEGGLKGAKVLDESLIRADFGYIPDSTDNEGIVVSAPACTRMKFKITGKAAHAGAEPEKGINAVMTAAKALSSVESGRIDDETTCNVGTIKGGKATNIVPDQVVVEAEARSHNPEKLKKVVGNVKKAFEDAVKKGQEESGTALPYLESEIEDDFPNISLNDNDKAVSLGKKAAANLGYELAGKSVGGGSDANILFHKGIKAGVIGIGMKDIHTTNENIALEDMVKCGEFLLEAIKVYSKV